MDRRTFVAIFAGGLLAVPGAEAQQTRKVYRLGFLSSLPVPPKALTDTLRSVGFIEGREVIVDRRVTQDEAALPGMADELVKLRPDVIVAYWNRDVVAARNATSEIPIVMVIGVDPVGAGLVANLSRPGANVTGSLLTEPAIAGKTLQVLKEAVPAVKRVAALWNPNFTLPAYYRAMEQSAEASGLTLLSVESRTAQDFEPALARMRALQPDAFFADGLAVPSQAHRAQLVTFAEQQQLPAVYTAKHWVLAGGLISYNASLEEVWSRPGRYVAKILGGAKPGELPIEGPTRFELAINLRTAKALGLTNPPSLLQRADQLIE